MQVSGLRLGPAIRQARDAREMAASSDICAVYLENREGKGMENKTQNRVDFSYRCLDDGHTVAQWQSHFSLLLSQLIRKRRSCARMRKVLEGLDILSRREGYRLHGMKSAPNKLENNNEIIIEDRKCGSCLIFV